MSVEQTRPIEWPGYCSICESRVTFHSHGPWHRDELVCLSCGSIPRQRAMVSVLSMVQPSWRELRIWEVAPAGPASAKLGRECPQYIGSQFWPDVPPGTLVGGVRCEDLERTTFANGSVDLVVSSDVFEHIVDVDTALREVARVLSPGGIHVWTTPQGRDRPVSASRVERRESTLVHLVPAEYHGDPVNPSGALVTFDWGSDLPDLVEATSGMATSVFRLESRWHGLLGEYLEVFVSRKDPAAPLVVDLRSRLTSTEAEVARMSEEARRLDGTLNKLDELEGTLDDLQAALSSVTSSRSWRITEPLRVLAAAVRRGRDTRA